MAVQEWAVIGVEETTDGTGRIPLWVIVYEVPEEVSADRRQRYIVPHDLLEIRAAEYGLSSVDDVLDVIVHEPMLGAAQAAGDLPMLIPGAVDAGTAHAQVTEQIAACRKKHGRVAMPDVRQRTARAETPAHPLQKIRDSTRIDPIRTASIRLEIDRHRLAQEQPSH
ncbi:hypothetical protein AB0K21_22120 [Streptosporangium sp. NPDC049248]|uniref:hypothetical protein n=1 Tax=Streptosporangium sp. NPDC049248 TaxID=3155651 RepID=UPI00342967F2